jgi:hypothetical protein
VFPRHANPLVTSRATLGVDVAAFEAALVRGNGPLFIQNDGTVTVPVGAAPASNSRYDVVYVKQNESVAPYADANNSPVFGFVSGTAAASPSLSAALALVPAGGLPLAAVLIPSTATTTQSAGVVITQQFPYTAAAGGTILFRNAADRDAFAGGEGQHGWLIDEDRPYFYSGSAWKTNGVDHTVSVAGTASGTLPIASSWIALGPSTTIPVAPFGAGVNYTVEVEGFTTQNPGSGGGFGIRCRLDGAAMQVGGQAQVFSIAGQQSSLSAKGRSTVSTSGSTHTVSVEIIALTADSAVVTGSTLSGYHVTLKRAEAV